jgi:hypothetical protein
LQAVRDHCTLEFALSCLKAGFFNSNMRIVLLHSCASIALLTAIAAPAEPAASLPLVESGYFRNGHGAGDWAGKTFSQIVPLSEVVRIVPLELYEQEGLVGRSSIDVRTMIAKIYNPLFEFLARSKFQAEAVPTTANEYPFETFILLTAKREAFKCWILGPYGGGVAEVVLVSHGNAVRIPIRGFSAADAISHGYANQSVLPKIDVDAFGSSASQPEPKTKVHLADVLVPQTIKRLLLAEAPGQADGIFPPRFPSEEYPALAQFDTIFRDSLAANPQNTPSYVADNEESRLLLIAITEDNELIRIRPIMKLDFPPVVIRLAIDARERHAQFPVAGAADSHHY